jgi:hypothetical protein
MANLKLLLQNQQNSGQTKKQANTNKRTKVDSVSVE